MPVPSEGRDNSDNAGDRSDNVGDSGGNVDNVLAAVADPMRRRILDLLADHPESTATLLADGLPVSRQAVVQHLAVLESVDLVASLRVGRERRYRVRPEQLTATAAWMTRVAQQWDSRLNAIRLLAESESPPGEAATGHHDD